MRTMLRLVVTVATFSCVPALQAALLTPNGNPTGAAVAGPGTLGGKSVLDPSPAVYLNESGGIDQTWLINGLNQEGFSSANGWTINFLALQGNIRLDTYLAWVDQSPAITQGAFVFGADNNPGAAGAEIGLRYLPTGTDPTSTNQYVNWVQVIHTNNASAFGTTNGFNEGNGFRDYIDNGYNSPTVPNNPFYGGLSSGTGAYAGNGTDFVDIPNRTQLDGTVWMADVFVATWSPNNQNDRTKGGSINIYDGVQWGFDAPPVPEPSTLILFVGLGATMMTCRVWRRSNSTTEPLSSQEALSF